jgi:hypothetical protein
MSYMATAAPETFRRVQSPRLRLVIAPGAEASRSVPRPLASTEQARSVAGAASSTPARAVLVAGGDAFRRAAIREELRERLAPDTSFDEASVLSEVLNSAATSRMVVLAGDLEDVSAKSLMHMVSHRYPDLPVMRLDVATPGADALALHA